MQLSRNYFELFDLPLDYKVNQALLAERYRAAQKAVHPDRHTHSSEADRRAAMQLATLVNTANLTLKDGLKRALYMLELRQVSIQENPELPPEFLMQQIELREELEALTDAGGERLQRLDAFRAQLRGRIAALEERFAAAIASCLVESETLVYELQFLHKLSSEAEALEEKLLEGAA